MRSALRTDEPAARTTTTAGRRRGRPRRHRVSVAIASVPKQYYEIQSGDTLDAIAAASGRPSTRAPQAEPGDRADGAPPGRARPRRVVALPFAAVKLRLALLAAACLLLAPSAVAGAPQVTAHAYLVQNGVTGEVLAASNPHARVPIASITKLMTVLVTLEHARLDDVVTVSRNAAEVGESSIYLQKGDRLTVGELVEAALDPERERRCGRARRARRRDPDRLRRDDERRGKAARPARHALREPGRARRGGPLLERARRDPARADRDEEPGDPRPSSTTGRRRSPAADS